MECVKILLNNEWRDVSAYIEMSSNGVEIQARCDEAYALGSLKLWFDLPYNIPPYTPLMLVTEGTTEYYLCYSSCTQYLTRKNLYVHDVTIIEATCILSCFILGSKNFSATGTNQYDRDKIRIIGELMEKKYDVNLVFQYDSTLFNKRQEFTFGPGTTMFTAVLEIAKTYNCVPKIYYYDYSGTKPSYTISFLKIDNSSVYEVNQSNILNVFYEQDLDQYCDILESEMTNVIDRNTIVHVRDLTCRDDDVKLIADSAYLKLPTRFESIEDWGVCDKEIRITPKFELNRENFLSQVDYKASDMVSSTNYEKVMQYKDWSEKLYFDDIDSNGTLVRYNLCNELWEYYFKDIVGESNKDSFYNIEWSMESINERDLYFRPKIKVDMGFSEFIDVNVDVSLKNYILPIEKWNLLEKKNQTAYAVYESGDDKINNLYAYYKDDLWSSIIGTKGTPVLNNIENKEIKEFFPKTLLVATDISINYHFVDFNPINYKFYVDYFPIVDLQVSSNKTIFPINENSFRKYSRSYSKSSNFIDFDRMIEGLQKSNDMQGQTSLSLEYRIANQDFPYPSQKIIYNGVEWYASSIIKNYRYKRMDCTINLVRDYSKVADAIGVPTQYNTTKNPLNNIIDRFIYDEYNYNGGTINSERIYFKFVLNGKILYKRGTILYHKNQSYIVCETEDNYCFEKNAIPNNSLISKGTFICNDIPYVDENNELESFTYSIVRLPKLTYNQSLELPYYVGEYEALIIPEREILCYKDAREHLIFTLKLTNVIID